MVPRLIDFFKSAGATALYLTVQGEEDQTDLNIFSLMDTWITVKNFRNNNELERFLYIVNPAGCHIPRMCGDWSSHPAEYGSRIGMDDREPKSMRCTELGRQRALGSAPIRRGSDR
jgi:hypothetical protein